MDLRTLQCSKRHSEHDELKLRNLKTGSLVLMKETVH